MSGPFTVEQLLARGSMDESPELRLLFHRLNNQLGIILAHAELLEAKAVDDVQRARASQVVASALEAMAPAKEIRNPVVPPEPQKNPRRVTALVFPQNRKWSVRFWAKPSPDP